MNLIEGKYSPDKHTRKEIGERFWELLEGHREELDLCLRGYLFAIANFMKRNPKAQKLLDRVQDEISEKARQENDNYAIKHSDLETVLSWAVVRASDNNYTMDEYNREYGTKLSPRRLE